VSDEATNGTSRCAQSYELRNERGSRNEGFVFFGLILHKSGAHVHDVL